MIAQQEKESIIFLEVCDRSTFGFAVPDTGYWIGWHRMPHLSRITGIENLRITISWEALHEKVVNRAIHSNT